ncbi:trimeric intracellular cation channel family protein [Corynebacterium timonense]|uniref:Uncharacterized membrane protein YeiH n=1 Tax=Corynebacterium timonense TaxID=441500 RepID=A0A1H1S886_9CORY|nr:trimeric intracellular cation channel family protein [Corynebacterium timonense]SDS44184.1 Uncharacterized membrane protein YeiH [Corynebacterium timonense]
MTDNNIDALLAILYLIGITAEAMTAAVSAGRMRMDLFGVITLGALTALGGGTVRDVLLDAHPLTWVEHPEYLIVVVVASVVTVRISWLMYHLRRYFLIADAIGLATFVVLGIQVALQQGYGFILCCVGAVTTGVCGGVMRDVLSGRVPLVFRKEMYAATAVIGTAVWWLLMMLNAPTWAVVITTLTVVLSLRLLSVKYGWGLPVYNYDEEEIKDRTAREEMYHFLYSNGRFIPGARQAYRGLRRMRNSGPHNRGRRQKRPKRPKRTDGEL